MRLFKKERKETSKVKVADIFVIKTNLISSYNDGSGAGPSCVTQYFLAKIKNEEICELFSGTVLEKENKNKNMDTYYVEQSKPLKQFLKNKKIDEVDTEELFNFINNMNVVYFLGGDIF